MFFREIDDNRTGYITLSQFADFLLPYSAEYSRLIIDRPEFFSRRGEDYRRYFNVDTRLDYQELWRAIFKGEQQIEKIRQSLKEQQISIRFAFEFLDRDCDGYLESLHLRDFLSMNGFYGTDKEIQGLM